MKKNFAIILCIVLTLSLLAGCSAAPQTSTTTVTDGQTVGEGAISFPLTIVDKEGNEINITVNTDNDTVGGALMELGIIEGEDGPYGLYMTHVNGIPAIYEEDGTYWAFYINGEYAMAGIELTPIAEGEAYKLIVEG